MLGRVMLSQLMTHVEAAYAAPTAEDASVAFFAAMEDFGASYLQTRLYRRPAAILTSASHWAASGFITTFCAEAAVKAQFTIGTGTPPSAR